MWRVFVSQFSEANFYIGNPTKEHAYRSQHETILADLNRYTTATRLVIILTDDAIKHTYAWPLA